MSLAKMLGVGAAATALMVGLLSCSSGSGNQAGEPTPLPSGTFGGTITMEDFYFQPDTLRGQVGKPLVVHLINKGRFPHNFTIVELNIDRTLAPTEQVTIQITPTQPGTFVFFDSIHPSHETEKGTLTIDPET